ncbi:DUF2793 domain-containing protein [Rhodobacter sp. Har01]|uniref:DUF2793 domain-containing protein n=1 Tax=Rhodobacter sp. Har01 TaxID=2883999 RepID=UPI001D099A63|nr:DUF2793 domain-containing protein [Rhodobacter sp. Har01]MCB6178386.1 DUF2793 domain-containing protein [Rhodobacter sp. Har01]
MADDTTILGLPLILPNQAQKHVTHNEVLGVLDVVVQLAVISRTLTLPPALAGIGDRYIVAAGGQVEWAGQDGKVAVMTETGWQFHTARPGWTAQVLAEGRPVVWTGLGWAVPAGADEASFQRLGVAATPDATNRLAVSSAATLLTHAGAGHQLKLNKAAAGDTASLLFQTGFSGRAEMGTAGADDFSVKVSADGSSWFSALTAAAATGEVTLPQPLHLGGQASDPAAPADGTMWLNTTTGEVKLRTAGTTIVVGTGGSGGGVSDGDKGDITVSGTGTVWSIDAAAVSLDKLADLASGSILGRATAGAGTPEALTAAQVKALLSIGVADVGSLQATLDGKQPLATVLTNTTASFTVAQETKLAGIAAGANAYVHPNHSGDVTSTGDGATVIAAAAVTNAKLANVATATLKGRATAGTGNPEDLTGTQATALLDTFTSGAKGLAPASGGGTTNFLRADGSWAAPSGGGGGSPGGASGEVQYNNGGAFAGAADVEIEGGQLRLPVISAPAAPAAGGVKLFGRNVGGRILPAIMGPSGLDSSLQPLLARNKVGLWVPQGNANSVTALGLATPTATGTATAASVATTNLHTMMRRIDYLVTTAATTAVAGFRCGGNQFGIGGTAAALGGFLYVCRWGNATGGATATHRAFVGLRNSTAAPTDVEPSSIVNMVGMGWDAADANVQVLHNDGSGTASKIDLGAAFPVPTADRSSVYELVLFSPPGTTQVLNYEVNNLVTGATASGTVTTDIPAAATLLNLYGYASVGGTSSVIGIALMSCYIETDY